MKSQNAHNVGSSSSEHTGRGRERSRPDRCQVKKCGRKAGEHEPPRVEEKLPWASCPKRGKHISLGELFSNCSVWDDVV